MSDKRMLLDECACGRLKQIGFPRCERCKNIRNGQARHGPLDGLGDGWPRPDLEQQREGEATDQQAGLEVDLAERQEDHVEHEDQQREDRTDPRASDWVSG
jgi:hypothetical protein